MLSIAQTVFDTVCREVLFSPGDTVYVALSGGADSVTLLHILCELKERLSLKSIRALHVNHGLRGKFADRDEAFVRDLCDTLQIPLTVEHADVPAVVRETHKSVEEAARDVRYDFFKRVTEGVEGAKIATAHTADDRAETVLLHLIRGCGLRGLRGIPYQRDNIVRPLLDCTAQQVRNYAAELNLPFVCDETNTDERYTRNYIRHHILPAFRQVNPSAVTAILRLSEIASADDEYLQNEAQTVLQSAKTGDNTYRCHPIAEAPLPVASRALVSACANACGVHPEQQHVDELLRAVACKGSVSLPGDWVAHCDGEVLRFRRALRTIEEDLCAPCVLLPLNSTTAFLGKQYKATVVPAKDLAENRKIHKNLLDFSVDYDMISGDMYLRTRREGDAFRPYKRHCTKTIKRFFQEQHVPADQRDAVALLCDNNGIVAVLGYTIDERLAARESTQQILLIQTLSEGSQ